MSARVFWTVGSVATPGRSGQPSPVLREWLDYGGNDAKYIIIGVFGDRRGPPRRSCHLHERHLPERPAHADVVQSPLDLREVQHRTRHQRLSQLRVRDSSGRPAGGTQPDNDYDRS